MSEQMYRWDIINTLIDENGFKSYLEIGYYKGWSFDRINAEYKTAVDPNPCKTRDQEGWISSAKAGYMLENDEYLMFARGNGSKETIFKCTSDEFFENLPEDATFDLVFIDGLHEYNQVHRDITNAIRHLVPGGLIVLHDTNPLTYLHTTTGLDGNWNGDTYREAVYALNHIFINDSSDKHQQLLSYTVDTDWGVTVLDKSDYRPDGSDRDKIIESLSWSEFDRNRSDLLRLISVEQFNSYYNVGNINYF